MAWQMLLVTSSYANQDTRNKGRERERRRFCVYKETPGLRSGPSVNTRATTRCTPGVYTGLPRHPTRWMTWRAISGRPYSDVLQRQALQSVTLGVFLEKVGEYWVGPAHEVESLMHLRALGAVLKQRLDVVPQVEFESRSRKQYITLRYQALRSRRFQRGFHRFNLHRPTLISSLLRSGGCSISPVGTAGQPSLATSQDVNGPISLYGFPR